jgi:putative hydrolase of the HAD superfamily
MVAREPVRLVCVDLGGVIVRIRRTLAESLHAVGVPGYALEEITDDEMRVYRDASSRHQRGELSFDAWLESAHGTLGARIDRATIARAHDAVLVGEYPGVARTLGAIRQAGTATACLSNTNDRHWQALVELPAMREIDHRHASHLLGEEKPDEAIFRAFENATGFRGGEILFLDDIESHCSAARAVGWNAVRIDHERDTASQLLAAARAHGVPA